MRLDYSSLRGEPGGSHTRYTVALSGAADAGWADAYRAVCEEAGALRKFLLDPALRTISFSSANVDGPATVMELLERIEALLALAAERRASWLVHEASMSPRTARSIA